MKHLKPDKTARKQASHGKRSDIVTNGIPQTVTPAEASAQTLSLFEPAVDDIQIVYEMHLPRPHISSEKQRQFRKLHARDPVIREEILFARAQTDVSIESLYAAFVECTEEEFRNARAALKEQQWHLIRDPYQRELFLFGQFRHMQFYEFKSILTDFRCGGYRILGDIICDYDDFYRKRGVKQARLRREDDSADLRTMLDGEDLLYRSNYKAEIRHRCRERLRSRLDTNLALRCAIALEKRKFALDVLNLEVYENALERTEQ